MGVAKVKAAPVEPEPGTFAAYLISAMDQAGLNIATLSRLTAETHPDEPVDGSTLSNLRTGKAAPGIKLLRKLAPHLGRSLGELLVAAGLATPDELGMVAEPLPEEISAVWNTYKALPTDKAKRALLNHTARSLTMFNKILEEMREFEEVVEGRRPPAGRRR